MKIYGNKFYEKNFKNNWGGQYPSEEIIRFFNFTKSKFNKKIDILDIGCGIGACSWFLAKEGDLVTAFDGSPSALKRAKHTFKKFSINKSIKLVHGDITSPLNFIKKKYDVLVDSYSLYSNKQTLFKNGLKEYYKILNDNGFFINCCFGKKTTGYIKSNRNNKNDCVVKYGKLSNGGLQSFFINKELNIIYKKIGFKSIFYENIIEKRNNDIIEKHINYLIKNISYE